MRKERAQVFMNNIFVPEDWSTWAQSEGGSRVSFTLNGDPNKLHEYNGKLVQWDDLDIDDKRKLYKHYMSQWTQKTKAKWWRPFRIEFCYWELADNRLHVHGVLLFREVINDLICTYTGQQMARMIGNIRYWYIPCRLDRINDWEKCYEYVSKDGHEYKYRHYDHKQTTIEDFIKCSTTDDDSQAARSIATKR